MATADIRIIGTPEECDAIVATLRTGHNVISARARRPRDGADDGMVLMDVKTR